VREITRRLVGGYVALSVHGNFRATTIFKSRTRRQHKAWGVNPRCSRCEPQVLVVNVPGAINATVLPLGQFEPQRFGDPIGEVGDTNGHGQLDQLAVPELLFDPIHERVVDVDVPGYLFRE